MATKKNRPKAEAPAQASPAQTKSAPLMLDLPEIGEKSGEEEMGENVPEPTETPLMPSRSASNSETPAPVLPAEKDAFQASLHEPEDPLHVLEAALFMSGQANGAAELARLVGIAALGHVNELLSQLSKQYDERGSALEVVQEENGKWVMRVRAAYAPRVRNFAGEAEISRHALRTLAYISKNEGIKKRDLFMRLGSTIYDDVAELLEKGFLSATPSGRTVSLKTTAKFKQYFQG